MTARVMSNTYTVEIYHQGYTYTLEAADNQTVLQTALKADVALPFSCSAGVCTTCAAQLLEGTVDQSEGMGLSPDLQAEGYALLCVSYPRSNLKIATEKEDTVYQRQFQQPQ